MLSLKNPIPKLITDPRLLKERIKGFGIYPYAGNNQRTSHSTLSLLYDLYELSCSRGSVINDKRDLGFTGKADVEYSGRRGLAFDDREISDAEKLSFVEKLEQNGVEWMDLINLAYEGEKHIGISGNVFILYKEAVVAGVKKVSLDILDPRHCYPIITKEDEADALLWTPQMDAKTIKDFEVYNVYPYFSEDRTTVFHFKVEGAGVWGRPPDLMAFKWMVTEALIAIRESKLANTELAAKILIIAEDEESESPVDGEEEEDGEIKATGLQKQLIHLRKIASTDTDETVTIAGLIYPHGHQAPKIEKLNISRDSKYLETQSKLASDFIYAANSWAKELVGATQAKGGIGSNMISSLFKWKYITKIKPRQDWWSIKLGVILKHLFDEDLGYAVHYPNRLEEFLDEHQEEEEVSEESEDRELEVDENEEEDADDNV